ncbi:MAG TPA: coproporphyrinogen-III oxidase family protein [Myxococcota bacterium]|nr:coproporphyrinogen-III oxidase family protein [Myxococcota bacterium]
MSRYGVYVHLPWCARRCHYCSFNVHVDPSRDEEAYTEAVLRQWETLREHFSGPPETLAFGGGTPSLHPPRLLGRLVDAIAPAGEISLEANPESMNTDAWLALGITRVSLGVQTFDPRQVRFLNRHRPEHAQRALEAVKRFPTWSVDLIFGLPDQELGDLDVELDRLLAHDPPHASLYGLTVHPGTAFSAAVARGQLQPAGDDRYVDLYERAAERLEDAGLARYEVSNFARVGHRSAHNLHYWTMRPYAGLGAGAHGLLPDGRRTVGTADPRAFIADPLDMLVETPTPDQVAVDQLLSCIRLREGTSSANFDEAVLAELAAAGLVAVDSHVRLVGPGWALADAVTRRLASAIVEPS